MHLLSSLSEYLLFLFVSALEKPVPLVGPLHLRISDWRLSCKNALLLEGSFFPEPVEWLWLQQFIAYSHFQGRRVQKTEEADVSVLILRVQTYLDKTFLIKHSKNRRKLLDSFTIKKSKNLSTFIKM